MSSSGTSGREGTPSGSAGKSAVEKLINLTGKSRTEAHAALEEAGFQSKGVTGGGYEKWYNPDGSRVFIGPDGVLDRVPLGGSGWRVTPNGAIQRPHTFNPERIN